MAIKKRTKAAKPQAPKPCGIVMPISATLECAEAHWTDVKQILSDAISAAGFEPSLVSSADETGVIQQRIIQNLYENEIVVCDVSCKNPNVMFELGLRLAFDKPTIIVKDDLTSYSFDTAPIEHLDYPRDLRFPLVVEFKRRLTEKIAATHQKAASDPNYTTFLKHFGQFTVAKLETKEIPAQEFLMRELQSIKESVKSLEAFRPQPVALPDPSSTDALPQIVTFASNDPGSLERVLRYLRANRKVRSATLLGAGSDRFSIGIVFAPGVTHSQRRLVIARARIVSRPPTLDDGDDES